MNMLKPAFWQQNILPLADRSIPILFNWEQAVEPISLKTAKANNNAASGFIKFVLIRRKLGIDTLEKEGVIFVVDHQTANTFYNKQGCIDCLERAYKKMLKPRDEFRIIYNNLTLLRFQTNG